MNEEEYKQTIAESLAYLAHETKIIRITADRCPVFIKLKAIDSIEIIKGIENEENSVYYRICIYTKQRIYSLPNYFKTQEEAEKAVNKIWDGGSI